MTAHTWPAGARRAILDALSIHRGEWLDIQADAVLDALADHLVPRADEVWEWAVRMSDGRLMRQQGVDEETARAMALPEAGDTVVRRRPAGEWEVAP